MKLDPLPSLLANYDAARAARAELDALFWDGLMSDAAGFEMVGDHPIGLALDESVRSVEQMHEQLMRTPATTIRGLTAKLAYAAELACSADPDGEWPTVVIARAAADAMALLDANWCAI